MGMATHSAIPGSLAHTMLSYSSVCEPENDPLVTRLTCPHFSSSSWRACRGSPSGSTRDRCVTSQHPQQEGAPASAP